MAQRQVYNMHTGYNKDLNYLAINRTDCKFSQFTGYTRVHAPICTIERIQALNVLYELQEPQYTQQSLCLSQEGHREGVSLYLRSSCGMVLICTPCCLAYLSWSHKTYQAFHEVA